MGKEYLVDGKLTGMDVNATRAPQRYGEVGWYPFRHSHLDSGLKTPHDLVRMERIGLRVSQLTASFVKVPLEKPYKVSWGTAEFVEVCVASHAFPEQARLWFSKWKQLLVSLDGEKQILYHPSQRRLPTPS